MGSQVTQRKEIQNKNVERTGTEGVPEQLLGLGEEDSRGEC
jgi:hypothetical protein